MFSMGREPSLMVGSSFYLYKVLGTETTSWSDREGWTPRVPPQKMGLIMHTEMQVNKGFPATVDACLPELQANGLSQDQNSPQADSEEDAKADQLW